MGKYSYERSKIKGKVGKVTSKIGRLHWKYQNLIFLIISIIIAYYVLKFEPIVSIIHNLGFLGYYAAFILGMLFTYALTAVPATAALYSLGQSLNPFLIALIGALGSVIADYFIFRFV